MPISFDAQSTSGVEAIGYLFVEYWLKRREQFIIDEMDATLDKISVKNTTTYAVAEAICSTNRSIIEDFYIQMEKSEIARHALEHPQLAYYFKSGNPYRSLEKRISTEIGHFVTRCPNWPETQKRLRKEIRNVSKTKKVIED